MREQVHGEVHRSADVDVNFLVCFGEIKGTDVERALHAGVIDEAVEVRVIFGDFRGEGG